MKCCSMGDGCSIVMLSNALQLDMTSSLADTIITLCCGIHHDSGNGKLFFVIHLLLRLVRHWRNFFFLTRVAIILSKSSSHTPGHPHHTLYPHLSYHS